MLSIHILSPKRTIYEGEAHCLRLPGNTGEFELLPHHSPIISLLAEGDILIDDRDRFRVEKGLVKCLNDHVVILLEERSIQEVDTAESAEQAAAATEA